MDRTELSQYISELHVLIVRAYQLNATCDATDRRFYSGEIRRLEALLNKALAEI